MERPAGCHVPLEFEAGDKEILLPLINLAEQLAERLDEFKPGTTEGFEEALNAAKDVYAEENPRRTWTRHMTTCRQRLKSWTSVRI